MIISNFINLKWHTVPLKGKLERTKEGKSTPIFEKGYREKYSEFFNEELVALAGALTGKISNIIAIDCDNNETYNLFKELDPQYKFHFLPQGKGGGTIIYKYFEIHSFSVNTDYIKLDLLSDNRLVYLPTEDNKTKVPMESLPCDIKEAPDSIKTLLKLIATKHITSGNSTKLSIVRSNLNPIVKKYVESNNDFDPKLFKIITPVSFRGNPEYLLKGSINPYNIKPGIRSKYLSQVSAILGADISVDIDLYTKCMVKINSCLETPLPTEELMNNIIEPMISGSAKVDNSSIWQEDKLWDKQGFSGINKIGDYIESFYDDKKNTYFIVNYNEDFLSTFKDKNKVITSLKSLTGLKVTESMYDEKKNILRTVTYPHDQFGYLENNEFNLFRQSEYLNILNNPEIYKGIYKKPETILSFLNSFIPDEYMREYLLKFIRTKFTTFNYSPIILYFLGEPGSGKDTFVSLLADILGDKYVERPDSKVFLEKHNAWLENKFIIHLDEYGDKLSTFSHKKEVLGRLKSYTGKEELQIRAMHSDAYNISHYLTFILTANSNPLPIDLNDRRFCIFNTPNPLHKQEWIKEFGGLSNVINNIKKELHSFCYYLATNYENLHNNDYVVPPESSNKFDIIFKAMPPLKKITSLIDMRNFSRLKDFAEEYNIKDFTEGWNQCRIYLHKLGELYLAINDNANLQALRSDLKTNLGLKFINTTLNGRPVSYIHFSELKDISPFSDEQEKVKKNIL